MPVHYSLVRALCFLVLFVSVQTIATHFLLDSLVGNVGMCAWELAQSSKPVTVQWILSHGGIP